MKKKECYHSEARYLDEQQVWYCPSCGQWFSQDPSLTWDDDYEEDYEMGYLKKEEQ